MTTCTESSKKSLSMILKEQPYLYDLHAHLLGMGNAGFWIDTILMDEFIMPTNDTFKTKKSIREALCPLVWDNGDKSDRSGFVNGKKAAEFFHFLVEKNIFRKEKGQSIEATDCRNANEMVGCAEATGMIGFEEAMEPLRENFPPALWTLIDIKLYHDLIHGGLEFKHEFSYDVILTLEDLGKGLGITNSDCEGFIQLAAIEKLGGHLPKRIMKFQHWIIFNARKQKFQIVYGIPVEQLRGLIRVNPNEPSEAAKVARAHVINAFSMCDAEGTRPRQIDFHSFHGFFTPEFYPRRFALKDSIYSQRLDVLAALIAHVIDRYRICLPPVKYCELSISANDLSKEWIFDVLRSVRIYDTETIERVKGDAETPVYIASDDLSSFSQIVLNNYFPYLQVAFKGPTYINGKNGISSMFSVTYKFLAGFDRRKIKSPFPVDQDQALHLLYNAPHEAILLMMEEINKSENYSCSSEKANADTEKREEEGFDHCLKQLEEIIKTGEKVPSYYKWVVGLDLFGDELGYPYCPFVAYPFIKFVLDRREENKYFGVRVHGGENVKYANEDSPAYRLFIAHMYIVFRCLLFLQQKLTYGIRIGHGIAFDRILSGNLSSSRCRKSSVLMAEMHNHANYLFKKIAFEVNLTSNEYLLGQPLRQADYAQILCLKELFEMKAPIILATDDDGIWPIDQCPSAHPGHHSVAAEYCRAISTSLINSSENLLWTFETMEKFCFWDMHNEMQESMIAASSSDSPCMNTVIVHLNIIELILQEYTTKPELKKNKAFDNYKSYSGNSDESHKILSWKSEYGAKRVAFVCICAGQNVCDKEQLRKEYNQLFDTLDTIIEEFDFIYDHWQNILADFVHCKSNKRPEVKIGNPGQNKQRYNLICSIQSPSEEFPKFLENIHWSENEINIRAYTNRAVIKTTVDAFEGWHGNTNNNMPKGTLLLYTNTGKYTQAYSKLEGQFKLQLNPHASKRETTQENFVYVLCRHASAASAALNLISKLLSEFKRDPSTVSSPIGNPVLFGSVIGSSASDTNDKSASENSPQNISNEVPECFTLGYSNQHTTANLNVRGDHDCKRPHSNDNSDGIGREAKHHRT